MQEHYLVIVGKREESKVLGCVWICLGENLERKRERICLENCPKSSSSSSSSSSSFCKKRGLGVFIAEI